MTDTTPLNREAPEVPLHDFLGLPADLPGLSADGNSFRIEVPLTDQMRGAGLLVHGGVFSTLIDIACGMVAAGGHELWNRGTHPVTTDLHIRYFRQPRKGPLIAAAQATHRGRRLVSVECVVTDGEERELTRASATYMVVEGIAPTT